MNDVIPIYLVVEDILSEETLRKILSQSGYSFHVAAVYGKRGFGFIKRHIDGFNQAARGVPFFVLTDLDQAECPPGLIAEWLRKPRHPNLLFRVAVREVEAWLMADRKAIAGFLGIAESKVPRHPEDLKQAKEKLLALASRSPRSEIRKAIAPAAGTNAQTGPDYNGTLSGFVRRLWNPRRAGKYSPSLERTLRTVEQFRPQYF
ncbi:MAG: hypothetical protein JXR96_26190 [Deltaproteobacteria bacterium]|nr:hypothetical protein [Deltaproteobacteria bacterium]